MLFIFPKIFPNLQSPPINSLSLSLGIKLVSRLCLGLWCDCGRRLILLQSWESPFMEGNIAWLKRNTTTVQGQLVIGIESYILLIKIGGGGACTDLGEFKGCN